MKRLFYFFIFIAIILCFLIVCELPFIKADMQYKKEMSQMETEIKEIPHVKEIYYIALKDFQPIFDLYIEMDDGVKIIFREVHYEGDVLMFKTLPRIGNFAFWTCHYNPVKKASSFYIFDIYDEFDSGLSEIGKSLFHRKNVIVILYNYRKILDKASTFHIASKEFLDYLKQGKEAEAFSIFDGAISKASWGIGCYEIKCMYKYTDDYKDTFFGSQAVWYEWFSRTNID